MDTTLPLGFARGMTAWRAWMVAAGVALLAACSSSDDPSATTVAPTITSAPTDLAVVAPAVAEFTATVSGDPTPTLQWQVSADNGATWTDIAGATGTSYTTPATTIAENGNLYRLVATNGAGSTTSAAARLTVSVSTASQTTVLSVDFDTALPASIAPGTATLVDVQGFADYGPTGNQFGGQMLRSATANTVTITLDNLPAHTWLSLEFLFAAIDSLDGTGTFPAGDFLEVQVDGVSVFNESFANADPNQIQSYVPPVGGELVRRVELGFWASFPESAYNMAVEPRFQRIPHSAGSVTITFRMEGSGESLDNESWGIENLRVVVGN